MAKHKKPAPAAKKPAAKPEKAATKKHPPVPAKKPAPASKKPAEKPAAKAPVKPAAKAEPAPTSKSRPPVPTSKTTPPVAAKAHAEPAHKPSSSKTTPPVPAKPVATSKSHPPIPVKAHAEPVAKAASAKAPVPAAPAAKAVPPAGKPAAKGDKPAKLDARELLRNRILGAKKSTKPIAFSLEEVREIAKTAAPVIAEVTVKAETVKAAPAKPVVAPKPDLSKFEKPATPSHVKAASLADILGFNPKKAQKATVDIDPEEVPEKFRRYYKLLLDLRLHITEGLNLHTEETLKRSAKDDAGDLSSYGQHMADAGTDTFDRDFALSLVSSEQEALTEIEAAIKRIHAGTYGICEVTSKPIAKDRLLAVPFTRYSAEAQKDIEKNRMRTRTAAGLFGELGEEGAKITEDDGGGDE